MAVRANELAIRGLSELRCLPTENWLRATHREALVADTTRQAAAFRPADQDAQQLIPAIAFLDELVDVIVDGVPPERTVTPWSKRPAKSA